MHQYFSSVLLILSYDMLPYVLLWRRHQRLSQFCVHAHWWCLCSRCPLCPCECMLTNGFNDRNMHTHTMRTARQEQSKGKRL